jgi:TatD DNase family protein
MKLVDTHCHLYLSEFENDREEMLQRARAAGVHRFYLPAIDSQVIDDMLRLEELYPGECISMIGLHPCSVKENFLLELKIVEEFLLKRKFVAVGEIGLDFHWDKTFTKQQYEAFNHQMELALHYNIPIVIHSREAIKECISAVKPFAAKGLKGIFHCFGDTYETAREIINMGFYLGIGGVLTYKKAGIPQVLENISLDHLVLETDAPYLSPVPFRGKRNESSYLRHIADKLAEAKRVTVEEVAEVTTRNAEKIFGQ